MPMLRTIDRPMKATLRSCACAASSTCCTRCTCEANDATMMRPVALAKIDVEYGPDLSLGGDEAGHLGVGGVREQQVHAGRAEPGEAGQVGEAAVERQLVHLEVAGVQHCAGRGRIATASASGIEWLTAKNSHSNGPSRSA